MVDIQSITLNRAQVAKDAALAGGAVLSRFFGTKVASSRKADESIVTQADIAAEKEVIRCIREHFPNDLILAEEAGEPAERIPGKWIWVIDPLDGTSNFYYGLDFFCCSVACGVVQSNGKIKIHAGSVTAPKSNDLYHAELGKGAFLNDAALALPKESEKTFHEYFLCTGLYYGDGERLEREIARSKAITRRCQSIRRLGAAALELCMVARGTFDGYWQEGLQPWDVAAASLIITEAGGCVRSYGNEGAFDIEGGSIVAGSSDVVDSLQKLI